MKRLLQTHRVVKVTEPTRGHTDHTVYALPESERRRLRRETKFHQVAARKRLLQARFTGWSQGTGHAPNLMGQAGELVARASLRAGAAAGVGYRHIFPAGASVAHLFGEPVPVGPLDDATDLFVPDGATFRRVTLLIEVKNVRRWIYESRPELFQLLDKAVQLQLRHPDQLFLPILICRKAQQLTFWMAKDLGFLVFYTGSQLILPHSEAPAEKVREVNEALGYDLLQTTDPLDFLTRRFRDTVPNVAISSAQRWQKTATTFAGLLPQLKSLRNDQLPRRDRIAAMLAIKEKAIEIEGIEGKWIGEDTETEDSDDSNIAF